MVSHQKNRISTGCHVWPSWQESCNRVKVKMIWTSAMDINVAGLWKIMLYLAVYHCNLILSRLCSCMDVFNRVRMCLIMNGCQRSPEHGFKLLRLKDKSSDACYKLGHIFSQHDPYNVCRCNGWYCRKQFKIHQGPMSLRFQVSKWIQQAGRKLNS